MDLKTYTDKQYVPISELNSLDEKVVEGVKKYRMQFTEIVQIDELTFANIVETPSLVKKRFIKNIELKGKVSIEAKNSDYILEIAKAIINNKNLPVKVKNKEKLLELYKDNGKDMTIITNYLITSIEVIEKEVKGDLEKILPELSRNEREFIKKYNNINLSYSINDFIELTKTSYETARKSFEKLKKLSLYTKTKIGKKFVYKPTVKLNMLIKGGS